MEKKFETYKSKIIINNKMSKETLAYREVMTTIINKFKQHQPKPLFYMIKSTLKHSEIINQLYPDSSKFSLFSLFYWNLKRDDKIQWEGLKYYDYLHEEGIIEDSYTNPDLQNYIILMLQRFYKNSTLPSFYYTIHNYKWYNNMQWWKDSGILIYYNNTIRVFYNPLTKKLREIDKKSSSFQKFKVIKTVRITNEI